MYNNKRFKLNKLIIIHQKDTSSLHPNQAQNEQRENYCLDFSKKISKNRIEQSNIRKETIHFNVLKVVWRAKQL